MSDHEVIAYDHAKHAGFLFLHLRLTLGEQLPWMHVPPPVYVGDVKRELAGPDARALVAVLPHDHDKVLGALVSLPRTNEIVWAYVAYSYRRFGIASDLAVKAGVDFARPVRLRYWTRAAERIRREHAGYENLTWSVTDDA